MGYAHGDKQYAHNLHQPTGKLDTSRPPTGMSGVVETKLTLPKDKLCTCRAGFKKESRLTLDDKLDRIHLLMNMASKIMYSDKDTAMGYMRYANEICSDFNKNLQKHYDRRLKEGGME